MRFQRVIIIKVKVDVIFSVFEGLIVEVLNSTPISQPLERHRVEKGETKTVFITASSSGGGCGLDVNLRFSTCTHQLWVPRGLLA